MRRKYTVYRITKSYGFGVDWDKLREDYMIAVSILLVFSISLLGILLFLAYKNNWKPL